jgi:hypothetical protein
MPLDTAYREIPLTRGQVVRVSAHRYEHLMQWKWYAKWNRRAQAFYAVRNVFNGYRKQRCLWMHKYILGLDINDPREGDHSDHNSLNNTDENLRISTRQQNNCNQRLRKDNPTGFKGVTIHNGRLRVRIRVNRKEIYIGGFPIGCEREAAIAYDQAALRHFGEFAHLNFPTNSAT